MIRQEFEHEIVRIWSDSLYDHQEVRKASNNRVRCLVRRRLKDLGYNVEETGEDKKDYTIVRLAVDKYRDKTLFLKLLECYKKDRVFCFQIETVEE